MLSITSDNEQKVNVQVTPKTASGKPAQLETGTLVAESVSGTATAEVASDGSSIMFISGDDPGVSEFLVTADADIGEGVETISESVTYIVTGVKAKSFGFVANSPEPK